MCLETADHPDRAPARGNKPLRQALKSDRRTTDYATNAADHLLLRSGLSMVIGGVKAVIGTIGAFRGRKEG